MDWICGRRRGTARFTFRRPVRAMPSEEQGVSRAGEIGAGGGIQAEAGGDGGISTDLRVEGVVPGIGTGIGSGSVL
jgi:hypothetical protein